MTDDKNRSLLELSREKEASIISQLVNIGNKRYQQKQSKFRCFIETLECVQPKGTRLNREVINAFETREYIALSYTWKSSKSESKRSKKYCIQSWNRKHFRRSKVRNGVFDRILRYMHYINVRFLWIDRHCIRQDTCKNACIHSRCARKRNNIHAMDLVYKRSNHPVALLGRPIKNRAELRLLTRILSSDPFDKINEATAALQLLDDITRDLWWRRAWTFQENHRGEDRMRLLIRHRPWLEREKLRYNIFGEIPGELCVRSVDFPDQATRLCKDLETDKRLSIKDISRIESVLKAAGRYKRILNATSPMTPRIIADIEAREMEKPWDRLALVANCCQYSVRLDDNALCRRGYSLSLSILAMCLLNGEILNFDDIDDSTTARDLTMSEFLAKQIFQKFKAPKQNRRQLTFNKRCRLTGVELTANGIEAKGHLWELGLIINPAKFTQKLPWTDELSDQLSAEQQKCLLQLVLYLREMDRHPYADRIIEYLAIEACNKNTYAFRTKRLMAIELASAIKACEKLRLGRICDPAGCSEPGYAIFIWSGDDNDGADLAPPAFVFTSAWPRDPGSEALDANGINRHVSLRVDLKFPSRDGVPSLRARSGLLGICFFDRCPRIRVMFQWTVETEIFALIKYHPIRKYPSDLACKVKTDRSLWSPAATINSVYSLPIPS